MSEDLIQQQFDALADLLIPDAVSHANGKDGKLYTSEEIAQNFGAADRTIRKWMSEVRQAWDWLPETDFKSRGKFTQFSFDQISELQAFRAEGGSYQEWRDNIQSFKIQADSLTQEVQAKTESLALIPNPTSIVLSDSHDDFYSLIQQELETQKSAENLTLETLQLVEAELVETNQEFSESEKAQRESRRREIAQKAIKDALQDEKDYQAAYIATRNQLRKKTQS
jgi:hypothetical protein